MTEILAGPSATVAQGSRVVLMVSRGEDPTAPPYARVPDVSGNTRHHATARLEQAGFRVQAVNEYSDQVPRSKVMGQAPAADLPAPEGSEVVLLVSSGPSAHQRPAVILPEVIGMHEDEAVSMIETAGLSPHVVYQYNAASPEGVVFAQMPDRDWLAAPRRSRAPWWAWALAAAALVLAAVVLLLLFGRQARVVVPDVVGETQARAAEVMREAGLEPTVATDADPADGVAIGSVSEQSPAPGTVVAEGSVVRLIVAGKTEAVLVPDVVGLTREEAHSRLRDVGFIVQQTERESADSQPGLVIEQEPDAGTQLPPGGRVAIVIAAAADVQLLVVPDVEGLARQDAEALLQRSGLDIEIAENPSTQVAVDVVFMQYPDAGAQVVPGTTAGLIVSSGAPEDATTTELPDVVGATLPDAQEEVAESGLRSLPVPVDGSEADRNDVIAQLPPGGAVVSPGSMALLFYSSGR